MDPRNQDGLREDLLANLGWVQRLARAIVRDDCVAEDVAQDVVRVALERREPILGSVDGLRAWLRAVAQRLAIDRARSEAARRSRERSVSRPERDDDAAEVVERGVRQQRVARAVLELDEPFRSTVLFRYLDELSMAEVARKTGVNEATARKRLSRGLELLRAKLDREFGKDTRSWAAALLAPAKGAIFVSTKWIAAAAAAAVVGLGWWGWRAAQSEGPSASTSKIAAESELAAPPPGAEPVPASGLGPPTDSREASIARVSVPAAAPDRDATILHVRVVDRAGSATSNGRVECWWSATRDASTAATRKYLDAQIVSEVTDILLPATAVSAVLRASAPGHLSTKEVLVRKLRPAPTARVERSVDLALDEALDPPLLRGSVMVDGRRHVPHAFSVRHAKEGHFIGNARVDVLDGSYAVSNATAGGRLWITSDETMPVNVELSEAIVASGVLDLQLSSGETLRVTLLDRDDGHPLANEDFLVSTRLRTGPTTTGGETRSHTTDSQGRCEVRGLVRDELVSISPALEPTVRPMIFSDDWGEVNLGKFTPTSDVAIPLQPWWQDRMTTDQAIVDVTLRVQRASEGATVFGTVPKEMLVGQTDVLTQIRVAADEVDAKGARGANCFDVPIAPQGQWSFSVHWPSHYLVWIETVKTRVVLSTEVPVDIPCGGRCGPIELHPTDVGPNFELELENVPTSGMLRVSIFAEAKSPRFEDIECAGVSCIHALKLDGPCNLTVTWNSRGEINTSEIRRSFKVDPARARTVRVDMGSDQRRTVEFGARGATVPAYALLGFGKLGSAGEISRESTSTTVVDGKVQGQLSLSPGRWFFECFDTQRDFNVTGVVDVASGSDTVRIERDVVTLERALAPHGLELTELDGVKLDAPVRYPWTTAKGQVILNATARYTALP